MPMSERAREYQAAYRAAHREELRAKGRADYQRRKAAEGDEFMALMSDRNQRQRARLTAEQKAERVGSYRRWLDAHPEARERYRERMREWNANHPGYHRKRYAAQRLLDPEGMRRKNQKWRLKAKYGLTIEVYDEMLAAQGGACAICGRPESMKIKGTVCLLAVDHDAVTKRVRGLLCVNCNMLIGGARHDPSVLRAAIAYLERPA